MIQNALIWPSMLSFKFAFNVMFQRNQCVSLLFSGQVMPGSSDPMDRSTPGPPVFHCLLELGQIPLGRFNDPVQPSRSLSSSFSSCLRNFPTSGSFPRTLLMRWPKDWSFSFRICPSSEHSGLISFRTDRFVLLPVQVMVLAPSFFL